MEIMRLLGVSYQQVRFSGFYILQDRCDKKKEEIPWRLEHQLKVSKTKARTSPLVSLPI